MSKILGIKSSLRERRGHALYDSLSGVIFSTPTYMFGMSSVLKRFFERWISFKAPLIPEEEATKSLDECFELLDKLENGTLNASNPLQGKVGGVVVAGSELGQDNVAKEIMLILNLYGFILPPQCFIYHTGHSMQSLEDVREGFYKNQWLFMATENLAPIHGSDDPAYSRPILASNGKDIV